MHETREIIAINEFNWQFSLEELHIQREITSIENA